MRSRFISACRWLQRRSWEFGHGIDIDQDGDIAGSGWMLRLEPPHWLRQWAGRQLPPSTEEKMRFHRQDISDVLLASLVIQPNLLGIIPPQGQEVLDPTMEWVE